MKCSTVVQSACSCDENSDDDDDDDDDDADDADDDDDDDDDDNDDDDHSNDGYNSYLLSCTRFLHCFNLECHTSHVVSSHITPLR